MDKKKEVISTARYLFTKYGFNKVSMDEIAKESKVTKKTIYTYFKSKNDLIKYFLDKEIKNIEDIAKKIDKENLDFSNKIYNIIMATIDYKYKSELLKYLTNDTFSKYEQMINESIQTELIKKIDQAKEKNLIKDCNSEITAFIIYKIYISLMYEWHKPIDKNEIAKNLKNILEKGLFN